MADLKKYVDETSEILTAKYDENNPPPYPVISVQGKTGEVTFTTETWTFTLTDGTTITKTVMLV